MLCFMLPFNELCYYDTYNVDTQTTPAQIIRLVICTVVLAWRPHSTVRHQQSQSTDLWGHSLPNHVDGAYFLGCLESPPWVERNGLLWDSYWQNVAFLDHFISNPIFNWKIFACIFSVCEIYLSFTPLSTLILQEIQTFLLQVYFERNFGSEEFIKSS